MAVTEDSWFEAMQKEIHEFDRLEVWVLVPKPKGVMIIALKWIYKVKLDEYGKCSKNKASVVAKGYRQAKGIDFENRLHPMDVKTAFLNGDFKRSLCQTNLKGFEDPNPTHVLLSEEGSLRSKAGTKGMKLRNMDLTDPVDTLMVDRLKLDEDLKGIPVDQTRFRGMVGSLMYLTASRPDLVPIQRNDPKVGSKTSKSAPSKDPVEEPTEKVIIDEPPTEDIPISDEGHVSDLEDTDNAHMPKIPDTTTWFRPILEEERPASPEPEWVIPPIDLPEADNNWANAFDKAHQDPDENKLYNKIDDIGSFIRWYCRRIRKEELSKADLEGPAFMMIDLVNPKGHRIVPDISNPLPLGGPPGQASSHNAISLWTINIVIRKRVEDLQLGIESYQTKLNLEQPNWDASDFPFKEDYTIVFKPRAVIYRDRDDNRKMMRIDKVHKFSNGTLTRIKEKLDFMVKDFKLFKFNKGMENRKWTEDDKRRSEDFIEVIERRLKIRRIFRSLESFVGGRLRDIDYRLISRTE
ncbi:uncharacterized mitochondrial protein-like protein [Tanacetum coccineum]|uniref:Uncharacterized mitochondrial protein-like protein n=1 Tax=Tanacetum coccineum TaxID=301880 RepID=A0ABQ5DYF3_9ASTR